MVNLNCCAIINILYNCELERRGKKIDEVKTAFSVGDGLHDDIQLSCFRPYRGLGSREFIGRTERGVETRGIEHS